LFASPFHHLRFSCHTTPLTSTLFPYTTLFRSKFLNIIDSLDTPTMYPVQNVKVGGNNKRFATYIYPLPIYSSKPYMVLSFFIEEDRKSTRLNSSHVSISYAVFCLKKKQYM